MMKGHQQPTGRAQSPLSSAFSIIILLGNFLSSTLKVLVWWARCPKRFTWRAARVCGRLRHPSALANSLHELEDYVHHLCVVKSVHFSTWNQQTFWRHGGGLPCSRPWLPTHSCYDVWRLCLWPDSNNAPQESIWMGRQTSAQRGTRFRMLKAQWTLAQSKYISEGTQKWTLLRSKVVPPGGPVLAPSLCQMCWSFASAMCASCQAWSYFNTNSIRGRNLDLERPVFACRK